MLKTGLILISLLATTLSQAATLRVATAANFRATLLELADRFETNSGHSIKISSASTGVIYNQVINGAPFDVFLAADSERPTLLVERDLVLDRRRKTYAVGQLVLAYSAGRAPQAKQGLAHLLGSDSLSLAIANPLHAPYGRAAQALLTSYPLAASARLVRAGNVGQAFQMWHSGAVDAALVGLSFNPERYIPVGSELHPPLLQQAVVLKSTQYPAASRAFLDFLLSTEARSVIRQHGYRTVRENG